MKAAAEFVMRGRSQAIGFAVITASLPFLQWLATAAVSLVVLRRGPGEGGFVLLWTMLPMLLLFFLTGNIAPVAMLLGTVLMAYVLRTTVSWELTLLTGVVAGTASFFLMEITSGQIFTEIASWYRDAMLDIKAQNPEAAIEVPTTEALRVMLITSMTMGVSLSMIGFLVLARWWQSMLYNPGGFQQEFHQVRLSPFVAGGLVVAVLLSFSVEPLNRFVQVLAVPLMISGLALFHWTIKVKQLSGGWLVSFYILLVLMQLYPVLVFVALLDSWFDLRQKIHADEV